MRIVYMGAGTEFTCFTCTKVQILTQQRSRLSQLLERWTVEHEIGLWDGIFEHRVYAPQQPLFVLRNTRPETPRVF